MTSPQFLSVSPTQPKVLPFASATDSTLHRPAWRSTRAVEPSPLSPRRPPSRFRSHLRYDLLGPYPPTATTTTDPASPPEIPESSNNVAKSRELSPNAAPAVPASDTGTSSAINNALTNLDELRWFQHRWLDIHGRNSNLQATREQLALMRRWFDSLDTDGSGEVGLDELEDPLVSVGLAGSRDDVQHLIQEVDVDGTGSVTFDAFLNLLYPERVKRDRNRRFPPPLHAPKHRPPARPVVSLVKSGVSPKPRRSGKVKATVVNPVARLFENLQEGKLGDLAVPFPVLITAYRRRMLLDAHMADNPTSKRHWRRPGEKPRQRTRTTGAEHTSIFNFQRCLNRFKTQRETNQTFISSLVGCRLNNSLAPKAARITMSYVIARSSFAVLDDARRT